MQRLYAQELEEMLQRVRRKVCMCAVTAHFQGVQRELSSEYKEVKLNSVLQGSQVLRKSISIPRRGT